MKKFALSFSVCLVLLAIFHLLVFLLPFTHSTTFWIIYAFTLLALLIQTALTCAQASSRAPATRFLKIPAFAVSSVYTAVQLIACAIMLPFAAKLAPQYAVLILSILFGVALIFLLLTLFAKDEVRALETAGRVNRYPMRALATEADALANAAPAGLKGQLADLAAALRYSPANPAANTAECDAGLAAVIAELKGALSDPEKAEKLIADANGLVSERNRVVNLSK